MTEKEAIKALRKENELCYKQCEGACCDVENGKCTCGDTKIVSAFEELERYREIGTVEECGEAREKQKPKKIDFEMNLGDYTSRFICQCGKRIIVKHDSGVMDNHDAPNYCPNCGQVLDWSD